MLASTFSKLAVLGFLATSAAASGSNERRQMDPQGGAMSMNVTSTSMMMNSTVTTFNGQPALEVCNVTMSADGSGGMTQTSSCEIIPIQNNGNGGFTTGPVATSTVFSTDIPAPTGTPSGGDLGGSSSIPTPTGTGLPSGTPTGSGLPTGTPSGSGGSGLPTPSSTQGSPVRRQNSSPSPSSTGGVLGAPIVAPFTTQLPGRAILVEPIGLIIYCIVTGIMLIIVAAVTFERIRYRRAFRRQQQMYQNSASRPGGQAFADNRV